MEVSVWGPAFSFSRRHGGFVNGGAGQNGRRRPNVGRRAGMSIKSFRAFSKPHCPRSFPSPQGQFEGVAPGQHVHAGHCGRRSSSHGGSVPGGGTVRRPCHNGDKNVCPTGHAVVRSLPVVRIAFAPLRSPRRTPRALRRGCGASGFPSSPWCRPRRNASAIRSIRSPSRGR